MDTSKMTDEEVKELVKYVYSDEWLGLPRELVEMNDDIDDLPHFQKLIDSQQKWIDEHGKAIVGGSQVDPETFAIAMKTLPNLPHDNRMATSQPSHRGIEENMPAHKMLEIWQMNKIMESATVNDDGTIVPYKDGSSLAENIAMGWEESLDPPVPIKIKPTKAQDTWNAGYIYCPYIPLYLSWLGNEINFYRSLRDTSKLYNSLIDAMKRIVNYI
jgi:hypothetical protein